MEAEADLEGEGCCPRIRAMATRLGQRIRASF